MHDLTVITLLAGALGFALVLGAITHRLGLSTLVGYLVAGVVVGPHTPGFVADASLASQMAEIGVILLMFGVGLHFHPDALLRVWRIAVPGAVAQSAVATVAGWGLAVALGWSHAAGAVFGMALGVASTVVLMKMLLERSRLTSHDGHVAVGWLIVEDLFTVIALVVLPVLAMPAGDDPASLGTSLLVALAKVAAFAAIVWLAGNRILGRVLERVARARSSELFTLTVFVVALGIARVASGVFEVSVALGAFFAGLVLGRSRFGPQAAADMAPFRDVFSALFFVSVGMLFDPRFVLREPWLVAGVLAIVLVVKPAVAYAIVRLLRDTPRTAATVSVGLAQVGEFSFILGALGSSLGVLPESAMPALVAGAIVSIALNPVLFRLVERRVASEPAAAPVTEGIAPGDVIVAGPGAIVRRIGERLDALGATYVAIDPDLASAEATPRASRIAGDPARDEVLLAAGVLQARVMVVAGLDLSHVMRLCMAARRLNPRIEIVAGAASEAEHAWLSEFGARYVCDTLHEQARELALAARQVL